MGGFLCKTKLNEVPQLWNIFVGDMSVVGPRPLTKETRDYIPQETLDEIQDVQPGLTGIGSIIFRDEDHFQGQANNPRKRSQTKRDSA
jgi:lipopolysaccharide/colanic/teichoic acid biosynthesis glycosyltransferase